MDEEVTQARLSVGLPREPFRSFGKAAEHGEPIVCKCVHCGKLFASASPDLADVEHICKGDCGCASQAAAAQKLERVAKAIFWELRAVMHDHDELWRKCDNQNVYRDCARAAIVAAAHG